MLQVRIQRVDSGAKLPTRAHEGDHGADLYACQNMYIPRGQAVAVSTGLKIDVPQGYELQIRPRSGLALKGITVANSPGTIDAGYRGEIKVILVNHSNQEFIVNTGDRIAQAVVAPVACPEFVEVAELPEAIDSRGVDGFGSTGIS